MRIADAYKNGKPVFSFEFFPPTNEEGMHRLHDTIAALRPLRPDFVSVTYPAIVKPADAARRELTIQLVSQIKRDTGIEAMAHLSFAHGSEFAAFARSRWPFCVAGATYPEPHLESVEPDQDVRYAKLKQDVGVEVLITQLFFENEHYFRFVRRARAAGVTVPIVPGVMPLTSVNQLRPTGMFARCGAHVPERLRQRIENARDEDSVQAIGIAWALAECRELLEGGAPGIHFYTLNRSRAAYAVYRGLTASVPAVGAR